MTDPSCQLCKCLCRRHLAKGHTPSWEKPAFSEWLILQLKAQLPLPSQGNLKVHSSFRAVYGFKLRALLRLQQSPPSPFTSSCYPLFLAQRLALQQFLTAFLHIDLFLRVHFLRKDNLLATCTCHSFPHFLQLKYSWFIRCLSFSACKVIHIFRNSFSFRSFQILFPYKFLQDIEYSFLVREQVPSVYLFCIQQCVSAIPNS